jgi:hemerythrin-like metal-binding protein
MGTKTFIEWSNKYSVGYDEIDKQHKKLISIINQLYASYMEANEKSVVSKSLRELVEYAGYHFKTEEALFDKFNYTDSLIHKLEHKQFVEQLESFLFDYQKNTSILSMKMLSFLQKWLSEHIFISDMNYKGMLG